MIPNFLLVSLFYFATCFAANAEGWSIQHTTSGVLTSTDGQTWTAASIGLTLPGGSWIRTGPRGRLVLSRGAERIMLRADTLAVISASLLPDEKPRVARRGGWLLFSAESNKRGGRRVATPHLASVVEGVIFPDEFPVWTQYRPSPHVQYE